MPKFKEYENINDYYGVKKDWCELMETAAEVEKDLERFFSSSRIKKASINARHNMVKMEHIMKKIRKNMIKTKQDWKSEY